MVVGAAIVTFNPQLSDLKILLSNISNAVKQIVIIDNGSKNIAEIKTVQITVENAVIIELGENKGIGFAQNKGISYLLNDATIESVILFDHDSHPEKEMIPALINGLTELKKIHPKIAAVGPVFVDPRTQNHYPISVFKGFSLIKKYPTLHDNKPIEASFLIASGSLIPRETLENVGLMNEGFFIDYIDIEWSFRATSKGYLSFVIPNAKMMHQVGDERVKVLGREISIHSPLRRYYLARNSVLMLKEKHINWKYKTREIYYSISRVIVYLTVVDKKATYLKYILRGWKDGFMNKKGMCTI